MLGKKILSVISLLFIGSALAATDLPNCTSLKGSFDPTADAEGSEDVVSYCIHTDDKIYEVSNIINFKCNANPLPAGTYVFEKTTDDCVSLSEAPSDWDASCTSYYSDNLCTTAVIDGGNCSGVTVDGNYKKVDTYKMISLDNGSNGNPVNTVAGLSIYTCGDTCAKTIGYIKVDHSTDQNAYYKIEDGSGDTVGESTGSANDCQTGKIKKGGSGICLSDTANEDISFTENKSFLVEGVIDIFTENKNKIIKSANNAITLTPLSATEDNNSYLVVDKTTTIDTGNTGMLLAAKYGYDASAPTFTKDESITGLSSNVDYCVDSNHAIWERKDGLCKASSDCAYYNCDAGLNCVLNNSNKDQRSQVADNDCNLAASDAQNCVVGYYIKDGNDDLVKNDNVTGNLYYCFVDPEDPAKKKCQADTTTIGYLVNKGVGSGTGTYIECTRNAADNSCKAIAVKSTTETAGELYGDSAPYLLKSIKNKSSAGTEITTSSNGKYFVDVSSTPLFGLTTKSGYAVVIEVSALGIKAVKETVGVRYRYTLSGEYSIHDRNVAITETSDNEICHNGVTPYEYTLVQWSDGETDIAEAQGLADYYIPTPNQS